MYLWTTWGQLWAVRMELMMIVMTMRMVRIATRFFIILDLWAKLLETDGVRERLAAGLEGEEGVDITWL